MKYSGAVISFQISKDFWFYMSVCMDKTPEYIKTFNLRKKEKK